MAHSPTLAERHFAFLAAHDAAAANATPEDRAADRSEVRRVPAKSGVHAVVQPHLRAVVAHGEQDAAPGDALAVRTDAPIETIPRVGKLLNERRRVERAEAALDLDAAITETGLSKAAVGRPLDMGESALRSLCQPGGDRAHADGDVGAMPPSVGEAYYRRRYLRAVRKFRAGQPVKPAAEIVMEAIEIVSLLPRALRATDPAERKAAALPLVKRLLASALDLLDSLEGA